MVSTSPAKDLAVPPPPPREVPRRAVWQIMSSDGWCVGGLIFGLLGLVFTAVGIPVMAFVVTAFVGVPFGGLGLLFLGGAIAVLVWRNRLAGRTVEVLREGAAVLGEIVSVSQNYQVRVNGRYPWTVEYDYEVDGDLYGGRLTTLSMPDPSQQPGNPVCVLFVEGDPRQSAIYPSPFGY
jgi:hypothetical protein